MLSDAEKKELKELAKSSKFREDLRKISKNRHNPFMVNGDVDVDRLIIFLTEYNYFINHNPKPFRRIIDKIMKL